MKLISVELKRLYSNKLFLLIVFAMFTINLLTFYTYCSEKEKGRISYSTNDFKQLYKQIEAENVDTTLKKYDELRESTLKGLEFGTEEFTKQNELYSELSRELIYDTEYQQMIKNSIERVKTQNESGIASFNNAFTKAVSEKKYERYSELIDKPVKTGPSKGVLKFSDYKLSDVIALCFIIISVSIVFLFDREKGQYLIYKTMVRGRDSLIYAKNGALIVNTIVAAIIFQCSNIVIALAMYGVGDLKRPVQSIVGFGYSQLDISVGIYILVFILMKILAYMAICCVGYLIAVYAKNIYSFYFFTIIVGIVCLTLCNKISGISSLGILKYANPYALLNTKDILGGDIFVNIAGEPVKLWLVVVISMVVYIVLCSYQAKSTFAYQQEAKMTTEKSNNNWNFKGFKHLNLFLHESYKLFVNGRALLIILVFLAFTYVSYKPVFERYYVVDNNVRNMYLNYLDGEVTEEKLQFIEDEREKFDRLQTEYDEKSASGEITIEQMNYYEQQLANYPDFLYIADELTPYLQSKNGDYYIYTGYQLLTGDYTSGTVDAELAIILVLVSIIAFSYIYGNEYKNNTINLISTTIKGRRKTAVAKFFNGMIFGTIIFILNYAPVYYSVLSEYGTKSLKYTAASMMHLSKIPETMNVLQYLIMVLIMRYLGILLMMLLIFFISNKVKNSLMTIMISIILFLLPLFMFFFNIPYSEYYLLNPLLIGNVF